MMASDVIKALSCIELYTSTLALVQTKTSGTGLSISRDLASASTDSPVMTVTQSNAGDNQPAMTIDQAGAGNALECESTSSGGRSIFISKNVAGAAQPPAEIVQDSTTGAIPCIILKQDDESEGAVDFEASDRGVINGATNSLASVRVELNGTVYRIALYVDG